MSMPPISRLALLSHRSSHLLLLRSLSTTPSRPKNGPLPAFQPTSSPELDELLQKFRSNIFLPAHLPKAQRDIIYRPKNHHLLTSEEPATVAIGDEVLQIHPLNRMRDEPGTNSSLHRIFKLMRNAKNWQNLAPLLTGLRNSKRLIKSSLVEQVVRNACERENEGAILECLRQADKTGLKLRHPTVAEALMSRAVAMAVDGDWTGGAVHSALGLADSVWIMMQDPKHAEAGLPDPTHNPVIVGAMVQLHAAKAVMFHEQKDTEGKVVEYTQRLLALWEKLIFPVDCDKFDADRNLLKWAPVWHGMKMARKVSEVTDEMKGKLGIRAKEMESALEIARKTVASIPRPGSVQNDEELNYVRRGVKLYEKLSSVSS